MTVSSIVPVNNYTGNSSTTQFDFDFLIEAEEELVVQHTDSDGIISTLTLGVDYSINETGNEEGSYIIFPLSTSSYNVLSRDETISLMLTLTIKQESEFKNSSYFNFTILEWTFDYIVRILQILSRQIERCVKVNEGSNSTADNILEELNNVLSTCITSAEFVSESQEQISEYVENIEQQISDFNTTYADCYQNILNSDVNTKLSQNQITNCILELPNRIKLELNSGTLTVKSGSVMIYPNGLDDDGNKAFEYYEVTSDISISSAGTLSSDCMFNLTTTKNGINILQMDGWYSGTSEPEVSGTALWYDTSNNLIKCTTDSGSNWTGASSLPFVIIERSSGTITRIKQILNGIGVIGNTIWIDEGVKIAVPNGRNEDGSLNNTIITNPGISIIEITNDGMEHTLFIRGPLSGTDTFYIRTPGASSLIFYQDTLPESSNTNQYWFDTYNNIWKYSSDAGASWTEFDWIGRVGTFTFGTNNIASFEIPYMKPYEAVDKSEMMRVLSDNGLYITTYISGTSGYREYFSDEAKTTRVLLEQWGLVTSSTTEAPIAVTFLKSYSDTNYNIQISSRNGDFPATYYTDISSVSGYTASTTGFYGTTSKSSSSASAAFYWHTIGV